MMPVKIQCIYLSAQLPSVQNNLSPVLPMYLTSSSELHTCSLAVECKVSILQGPSSAIAVHLLGLNVVMNYIFSDRTSK